MILRISITSITDPGSDNFHNCRGWRSAIVHRQPSITSPHQTRQALARTIFWPALQPKACCELRHVRNHVVDAEDRQRVRVGGDDQTRDLRPHIRAPRIRIREEEALAIGPAVRTFVVERFALLLECGFERVQREMDAAVVGRVFALGEQAILFHAGAGVGNVLRVLVGDALAAFVILLAVFRGPPVAQVAVSVELAALIVEAVNDFVTDDHADGAVVHRVIHVVGSKNGGCRIPAGKLIVFSCGS